MDDTRDLARDTAPPRMHTPSSETTAERAVRLHDREGLSWSRVAAALGLSRHGLVATIGPDRWLARVEMSRDVTAPCTVRGQ